MRGLLLALTREDIVSKKLFPDGTVPTTWDIDLHYPKEQYAKKFPEAPFISKPPRQRFLPLLKQELASQKPWAGADEVHTPDAA